MESAFLEWTRAFVAAYLGVWLLRGATALWRLMRAWAANRSAAGRLRQMQAARLREDDAWLCLAGLALGLAAALCLARQVAAGQLLPALLAICLGLEELRPRRGLEVLPSVMALLNACRSNHDAPLLEIIEGAREHLPPGAVRAAAGEATRRFRQGLPLPDCMAAFSGIHPCLDEFIADAAYASWQAGPALNVVLEQVIHKAAAEWNRTVAVRRFFEQAETWLALGRYTAAGALAAAFYQAAAGAPAAFELPARQLVWGAALVLASSLGLYAALSRPLLRRGLLVAAVLWLGLWWAIPLDAPAQALEPTGTPVHQVTSISPSATARMAATATPLPTATPPLLPTATAPRHPVQSSATPGEHQSAATSTAPPLPTATSPAMIVPLTPTAPPAPQEAGLPTAPAVPLDGPTPPPVPGG